MGTELNFTVAKRYLATKTLEAIEEALKKDGGSRYRKHLKDLILTVDDAYREENDEFRTHLGASQIGTDCLREMWYIFRWAVPNVPEPRFIRLFNRGHLEEARLIALLLMIDCEVWRTDSNGKQFRVSYHGGHFGGASDLVVRGLPDWPEVSLLGELKTHKDDSFTDMEGKGLRVSKFKHYSQMQVYINGLNLPGGFYFAVNKDNDHLYAELVEPNTEFFATQKDRAKLVVFANHAPKKINESPGWWMCKMCRQKHICHKIPDSTGTVPLPARNCRTCLYSKPLETGGWECTFHSRMLSKEDQAAGCEKYTLKEM